MIGIMFKVRFYRRYARQQGGDLYFRELNRVRQRFTFYSHVLQDPYQDRCQKLIFKFLAISNMRLKFKRYIDKRNQQSAFMK